jgi:hypothetical protein
MSSREDDFTFKFTDSKGRSIVIQIDEGSATVVQAYHNDKKIGEFETHTDEDGHPYADVIAVEPDYKRAGIGRQLVHRAFLYHSRELIPPGVFDTLKESGNRMSDEGRALMRACQEQGWVGPFHDYDIPAED